MRNAIKVFEPTTREFPPGQHPRFIECADLGPSNMAEADGDPSAFVEREAFPVHVVAKSVLTCNINSVEIPTGAFDVQIDPVAKTPGGGTEEAAVVQYKMRFAILDRAVEDAYSGLERERDKATETVVRLSRDISEMSQEIQKIKGAKFFRRVFGWRKLIGLA